MSCAEIRIIHDYLESLPWLEHVSDVQPLTHVASNQHFKVELTQDSLKQTYFLKCFHDTNFIPLNRRANFELQKQVAEVGLAPMPVQLSEQHQIQIEQWVGDPAHEPLSREQLIDKTAATMAKIHQLPVRADVIDLPQHWQRYLNHIPVHYHESLCERMDACTSLWETSNALCLCHHDLSFEHLSGQNSDITFDWEYAALGDPYFDIACCMLINELSVSERHCLLSAYVALMPGVTLAAAKEKVAAMEPLALLTSELWQLAYDNNSAVNPKNS